MKIHLPIAAAVLGLPLCSCSDSGDPSQAHAKAQAALPADTKAVMDLAEKFVAGWEAKDPVVKSLYAPDATIATPNSPPAHGPTSIKAAFDQFAASPNVALDFDNAATVMSGGNLAFSQGTYTARLTNPQTKAIETRSGYYVLIYKKQPDGSWKVIQDVSSPLPRDTGSPAAL